MWTKLQVIKQAYSEIGKADYEFDLNPEDVQSALRQMDAMLASWSGLEGIRIGFAGGDGFGEADTNANVPLWAVEAIYLNLALRLAPSFGKTPSQLTVVNAKAALDAVKSRVLPVSTRKISGYGGAGNARTSIPQEPPSILAGNDNTLALGGA